MKLKTLLLLSFYYSLCLSQNKFEPGYYIDNNGNRHDCSIKNYDWKNNPNSFEIKSETNPETTTITINNIKEIAVDKEFKFVKANVDIDISSNSIQTLDNDRNPKFVNKILLLKVLVEGPRNLYSYEDDDIAEKFFFSTDSNQDFKQLIFKKYFDQEELNLVLNENYKKQLNQFVYCTKDGKAINISNVTYEKSDLTNYFSKVNSCLSDDYKPKEVSKKTKTIFAFKPLISLDHSDFDLIIFNNYHGEYKVGVQNNFGFGAEVEIIFPFYNNNWSVFVQASYHSYKSSLVVTNPNLITPTNKTDVKIVYFEVPIAARRYIKVNANSKIFLNLGINILVTNRKSAITFESENPMLLDGSNHGIIFGAGFDYKKFSIEINKFNDIQLNNYLNNERAIFKNLELNLKYKLF